MTCLCKVHRLARPTEIYEEAYALKTNAAGLASNPCLRCKHAWPPGPGTDAPNRSGLALQQSPFLVFCEKSQHNLTMTNYINSAIWREGEGEQNSLSAYWLLQPMDAARTPL